jgi:hypothetical protein
VTVGEELADDAHALVRRFPRRVDRLRKPLAQRAVMIDERVTEVCERQPPQQCDGRVRRRGAGADVIDQSAQRPFVHRNMLPGDRAPAVA